MKYFITIVLLLCLGTSGASQIYQGQVRDQGNGTPLPYANIGVINKNIGGISDADGRFKIDLSGMTASDSLMISYIGYQAHILPATGLDFVEDQVIELAPDTYLLQNIQVVAERKAVKFGHSIKKFDGFTGWGFNKPSEGMSRGTVIQAGRYPLLLQTVGFNIRHNTFDSVKFRLHLVDFSGGNTGQELLQQNIFFTVDRKGWISIDLQAYQVWIENDFILAVEWVDAWSANPAKADHMLTIALSKEEGYFIVREAPHDQWQVSRGSTSPALYVEVFQF